MMSTIKVGASSEFKNGDVVEIKYNEETHLIVWGNQDDTDLSENIYHMRPGDTSIRNFLLILEKIGIVEFYGPSEWHT